MGIKKLTGFLLSIVILGSVYAFQTGRVQDQEYNLKAAFLYRFLEYVEWEENNSPSSSDVNIIVLGESNIYRPLLEIAKNRRVDNRRVRISQYYTPSDLRKCNILFISKKYRFSVESVLAKLSNQSTLVISESENDFELGTHINFMISDNKLKFAVNLRSTSRSGIKISSQLLQHAVNIKR